MPRQGSRVRVKPPLELPRAPLRSRRCPAREKPDLAIALTKSVPVRMNRLRSASSQVIGDVMLDTRPSRPPLPRPFSWRRARSLAFAAVFATLTSLTDAETTRRDTPLAPELDGLGTLHAPVTTANPKAQRFFDQGLRFCTPSTTRRPCAHSVKPLGWTPRWRWRTGDRRWRSAPRSTHP
jgi:hypothetical protein